jgi:hypothetical protein
MAVGSYGPAHCLPLFDEAAALRPRVIVATYYFGNDLFDSYSLVYHTGFTNSYISPNPLLDSFASTDARTRNLIQQAEKIDPGFLRWKYLSCDGRRPVPDSRLQQVEDILTVTPLAHLAATKPSAHESWVWTKIQSLLMRSLSYRITWSAVAHFIAARFPAGDYGPPICVHFHDRQLRTVFTVGERLIALSRTDPRMVAGERISLAVFRALVERCRRAGIRFYVALIPTKESAFRARAEASQGNDRFLRDLWNAEAIARANALAFFNQASIDAIDARSAREATIASGVNPYREDFDSHPLGPGYQAIAQAVPKNFNATSLVSNLRQLPNRAFRWLYR